MKAVRWMGISHWACVIDVDDDDDVSWMVSKAPVVVDASNLHANYSTQSSYKTYLDVGNSEHETKMKRARRRERRGECDRSVTSVIDFEFRFSSSSTTFDLNFDQLPASIYAYSIEFNRRKNNWNTGHPWTRSKPVFASSNLD